MATTAQLPSRPTAQSPIVRCALVLALTACLAAHAQQTPSPSQDRARALMTRLNQAEAQIPPDERYGPGQLAQARLAFRKTAGAASYWGDATISMRRALDDAEKAISLLEQGKRLVDPGIGFQERAYISQSDGSPEPYFVYVPTRYDVKSAWPLLIFLHGYTPTLDPSNWFDIQYSPELEKACEEEGVILLVPFGRRNTEFMGIGETDVLKAIDCVRREYNVDARRIIISGASMGGSGAYSIACHYPDRFAAVIGLCGRADYYQWMNVRKESLPPFKQAQMDADYARELLPNLRHVPVLIFHGGRDNLVQIEQSRNLEARLKELGQQVKFFEIEDAGHNDVWTPSFNHPAFRQCLREARLKESPDSFTFRTMTLKYSGAYWVRIESLQTWGRMAEVRASVAGPNAIDIKAQNVVRLTIGPSSPIKDFRANLTVNGKPVEGPLREDGQREISLAADTNQGKTPAICGPIREAYDGPFMIVYPADDAKRGALEDRDNAARLLMEWIGCAVLPLPERSEELRMAVGNWSAFKMGPLPIRSDAQVTEREIAQYNLILCGSPVTNGVLARIASDLPLKFEEGAYRIGEHGFPSAGRGVECIYPNPLNPKRYVMVVHGAAWGPRLSFNHKLDFQPDFIIYSKATVEDRTLFPTNHVLCAGYFDQHWQVSADSLWVNPAPETEPAGQDTLR